MVRGQLKIQQMAFVLMAIVVFLALAGLFALSLRLAQLRGSASELEERNALTMVTRLANTPEFSCGDVYGSVINCIDADKAMGLRLMIKNYTGFWGSGVSKIEIRKIYPEEETKLCDLKSYPSCNSIVLFEGEEEGFALENFVSLCRKEGDGIRTRDKCEVAKLKVYYSE